MHNATVYQLRVTLVHSEPPVWRRLLVTGETPLDRLHQILQITMGWDDTSPHAFEIDGTTYGEPFDEPHNALPNDLRDDLRDAYGMPLAALAAPGTGLVYRYDFAAGWEVLLEVEALLPPDAQECYPRCTDGALAAPPERCAGIAGYHRLRAALDLPTDPQHGEAVAWLGEPFDPENLNAEFADLADSLGGDRLPPLPVFDDAELAALDEAALIELLRSAGDRAPRNLVDACAARGAAMVRSLAALLDTDTLWNDAGGDAWWLGQHAAMIAGLIPGAAAGQLLVDLLEGIHRHNDEATEE